MESGFTSGQEVENMAEIVCGEMACFIGCSKSNGVKGQQWKDVFCSSSKQLFGGFIMCWAHKKVEKPLIIFHLKETCKEISSE